MKKYSIEFANKLNADLAMAIEATSLVAGKLKNGNLKKYLFTHAQKYEDLQNSLKNVVSTSNKKLKSTNIISRAFLWMQFQLSSISKNEESDYVESVIKGSEMGINSSTKLLKKYSDVDENLKKIAFDLQTMEIENLDKLKDYLKRSDY